MNVSSAQYIVREDTGETSVIKAVIDDVEWFVPIDTDNTTYTEIMRQVVAGDLVIQEADNG